MLAHPKCFSFSVASTYLICLNKNKTIKLSSLQLCSGTWRGTIRRFSDEVRFFPHCTHDALPYSREKKELIFSFLIQSTFRFFSFWLRTWAHREVRHWAWDTDVAPASAALCPAQTKKKKRRPKKDLKNRPSSHFDIVKLHIATVLIRPSNLLVSQQDSIPSRKWKQKENAPTRFFFFFLHVSFGHVADIDWISFELVGWWKETKRVNNYAKQLTPAPNYLYGPDRAHRSMDLPNRAVSDCSIEAFPAHTQSAQKFRVSYVFLTFFSSEWTISCLVL